MSRSNQANDGSKRCGTCNETKELSLFHLNSTGKYGRAGRCKACIKLSNKKWYEVNREESNTACRDYYQNNKAKVAVRHDKYQKKNRAQYTAYTAAYNARRLLATVGWSCKEAIAAIYREAKELGLEVDHIVPLQGKEVCGLHCEDNLQLLTRTENRTKGNKHVTTEPSLGV